MDFARGLTQADDATTPPHGSIPLLTAVPSRTQGRRRLALGIVVGVACLAAAVHGVQPARLWDVLRRVDLLWFVAAVVAVGPAFAAMSVRWSILLRPSGRVTPIRAGRLLAISYLINAVVPARGGDLARCFLVGRPAGPALATALATVLIEKALDGAAVVLLLLFVTAAGIGGPWLQRGVYVAGFIFLVILFGATLAGHGSQRLATVLSWFFRPWPRLMERIVRLAEQVALGAAALTSAASLLSIVGLTAVVWAATLVTTYCLTAAFGIAAPTLLPAAALGIATLGLAVPATPGGVGAYQLLVVAVLSTSGIARESALAFGLALQLCQVVPLIAIGAIAIAGRGRRGDEARGR